MSERTVVIVRGAPCRPDGCRRGTRYGARAAGPRCARSCRSAPHGAAHRVHHAAELNEDAVAGALHHAPVVHGDGRIDRIASESPQPRQRPLLVLLDIRRKNGCEFPVSAMAVPSPEGRLAQLIVLVRGPTRSFDLDQTGIAKSRGSLKLPWCCSQITDTGAHNVIGNHEHSAITGGLRGGRTRCIDISEFCQPMFAGDRPRAGQV